MTFFYFYYKIYIKFYNRKGQNMARTEGDKNLSPREMRLKAENEALKAKVKAEQANSKVKDARIKELKAKK